MHKAIIILPTYNERGNIKQIIDEILQQQKKVSNYLLQILVVDDSSPDGTGLIVKKITDINPNVFLLTGQKEGLGTAYIKGFKYAIKKLKADVILEMDADFSHNPNDIPRLLRAIEYNFDFVIGSRYTSGGKVSSEWSLLRKLNSKLGNMFARHIAGLNSVHDCTGGFRAIKTELLKKINLRKLKVKGYAFQITLLHQAIKHHAKIVEVPIHFQDRLFGKSKISVKDIIEFIKCVILLRFPLLKYTNFVLTNFFFGLIAGSLIIFRNELHINTSKDNLILFFILFSLFMIIQMMFTIYWMIYAWEDPQRVNTNKSPTAFEHPQLSFTAIIPARHEEHVIADTIKAISNIYYPEALKEIIIVCRSDDNRTINKAYHTIISLNKPNIRLVTFNDFPINKPHSLNIGLANATKDVVVVFDAEDEPHTDIYNIVNTVMLKHKADVVQSGVQLMNYKSKWFSTLNVLEYFFWFKSALHLFTRIGAVPLGGNTVFFKKDLLEEIDGWNETFLTEDADIGIRLSLAGAKIKIVYDEEHVTKEETPATLQGFIKQRTRWNQGFIQVFLHGLWFEFPSIKQKTLSVYILLWPLVQALLLIYLPLSIFFAFTLKLPIIVDLVAFIPVYLLFLQMIIYIVGLYEFTRDYRLKFPVYMPLMIILTFYPYQLILGFSSMRAILRLLTNSYSWEKTLHINAHRENIPMITT